MLRDEQIGSCEPPAVQDSRSSKKRSRENGSDKGYEEPLEVVVTACVLDIVLTVMVLWLGILV